MVSIKLRKNVKTFSVDIKVKKESQDQRIHLSRPWSGELLDEQICRNHHESRDEDSEVI
jgi:hypothetical protein